MTDKHYLNDRLSNCHNAAVYIPDQDTIDEKHWVTCDKCGFECEHHFAQEFDRTGRPTKRTPELIKKLLRAFEMGYTVTQACSQTHISTQTFYTWINNDPALLMDVNDALERRHRLAKAILAAKIENATVVNDGEVRVIDTERETIDAAFKLLEKIEPRTYGTKVQNYNMDVGEVDNDDFEKMDKFWTSNNDIEPDPAGEDNADFATTEPITELPAATAENPNSLAINEN